MKQHHKPIHTLRVKYKDSIGRSAHTYGVTLAQSLIQYARFDKNFFSALKDRVRTALPASALSDVHAGNFDYNLVIPCDQSSAIRRADWLVARTADRTIADHEHVRAMLASWAHSAAHADPRAVVIGIIGIAIPGFTLGLIRRRVTMAVVLRANLARQCTPRVTRMTCAASLHVLNLALRLVQNDSSRLEPEIADWFFGDRDLELYAADEATMRDIETSMRDLAVPCGAVMESGSAGVLALSPATNSKHQRLRWKLRPL